MFSAFNPFKCTHTWNSGQPTLQRPGSSRGFSALLKGLTSSPGLFLPEPRFKPTTSGYKSDALSIRPRLPITVSRVLNGTIAALTIPNIVRQFIDFPTDLQTFLKVRIGNRIEVRIENCRLPGVVGAIDGTHVCIISPAVNEEAYINRKGLHSINVHVVFNAAYKILDLVPKWPG